MHEITARTRPASTIEIQHFYDPKQLFKAHRLISALAT